MDLANPILFALECSRPWAAGVAGCLGLPLSPHEERAFEDGEHMARPLLSVRGRDVYVLHALQGPGPQGVNDRLCQLLFFIGAVKDASAARVTAVLPYLAYARKDRKSTPRDPVTTRYIAALFEAVGTDRVVTLDLHNLAGYQNAVPLPHRAPGGGSPVRGPFRGPGGHGTGGGRLARCRRHQAGRTLPPRAGGHAGAPRARGFRREAPQRRRAERRADGGRCGGSLRDHPRRPIATGGTLARTAHACIGLGASRS